MTNTTGREAITEQSRQPDGYAYRYPDPFGGIRFNDGREVNGCKPIEALPYWFTEPNITRALEVLRDDCAILLAENKRLSDELDRRSAGAAPSSDSKPAQEKYLPDWVRVELAVSPDGECHALGGDRGPGPEDSDRTYIGLERLKKRFASKPADAAPTGELPPLPNASARRLVPGRKGDPELLYTADQVRAVQREAYELGKRAASDEIKELKGYVVVGEIQIANLQAKLAALSQKPAQAGDERAMFEAWEAHRIEQSKLLGMPGLMAKPSFIAGYRAALSRQAVPTAVPAGFKLMPVVATTKILSAMATSRARDDEGDFPLLMDLIDFSGENKTHTVLRAAYDAAIAAAPAALVEQTDALIDAAEAHAARYAGDPRDCIETDVMNAFYAGAEFTRASLEQNLKEPE